jgi:acyl-coenzyme A thioesterase PaaI-like protein
MTDTTAFQDAYPDDLAQCYGCGRLNDAGLHIKSRWDGDTSVALVTPRPEHVAIPGYVYGGLIASVIDCHGTGTASAAAYRAAGRPLGSEPVLRFVTAALHIDYLKPTPLGVPLEIRGTVVDLTERKVVVDISVSASRTITARGQVIAVRMPESLIGGTPGTSA